MSGSCALIDGASRYYVGATELTPVIQRIVGKVHLQHVDVLGLVSVTAHTLASDTEITAAYIVQGVLHFRVVGNAVTIGRRLVDILR
jgi:hypothetical protein